MNSSFSVEDCDSSQFGDDMDDDVEETDTVCASSVSSSSSVVLVLPEDSVGLDGVDSEKAADQYVPFVVGNVPLYLTPDENGQPVYVRQCPSSAEEMFSSPNNSGYDCSFGGFSDNSGSTFEGFGPGAFEGFSEDGGESDDDAQFDGFSDDSAESSGKQKIEYLKKWQKLSKSYDEISLNSCFEDSNDGSCFVEVGPSTSKEIQNKSKSSRPRLSSNRAKSKKFAASSVSSLKPKLSRDSSARLSKKRRVSVDVPFGRIQEQLGRQRHKSAPDKQKQKRSKITADSDGIFMEVLNVKKKKRSRHHSSPSKSTRAKRAKTERVYLPLDKEIKEEIEVKEEKEEELVNPMTYVADHDTIGFYCNMVGCTISWLESMTTKDVTVTNGMLFELDEFAKKINWERFHMVKWILRLRGILNIEPTDADLEKIHVILKRRKALTVTLAGNKKGHLKLQEFDTAEFILPSAIKREVDEAMVSNVNVTENEKDVSIPTVNGSQNKAATCTPMVDGKLNEGKISEIRKSKRDRKPSVRNRGFQDKSMFVEKSLPVEADVKKRRASESYLEDVPSKLLTRRSSEGSQDYTEGKLNAKVKENLKEDSQQKSLSASKSLMGKTEEDHRVKYYSYQNRKYPYFLATDDDLGESCTAVGLSIADLNSRESKNFHVTQGVVLELYKFYKERGCTLTALTEKLMQLKKSNTNRISLMSKIVLLLKNGKHTDEFKSKEFRYPERSAKFKPKPVQGVEKQVSRTLSVEKDGENATSADNASSKTDMTEDIVNERNDTDVAEGVLSDVKSGKGKKIVAGTNQKRIVPVRRSSRLSIDERTPNTIGGFDSVADEAPKTKITVTDISKRDTYKMSRKSENLVGVGESGKCDDKIAYEERHQLPSEGAKLAVLSESVDVQSDRKVENETEDSTAPEESGAVDSENETEDSTAPEESGAVDSENETEDSTAPEKSGAVDSENESADLNDMNEDVADQNEGNDHFEDQGDSEDDASKKTGYCDEQNESTSDRFDALFGSASSNKTESKVNGCNETGTASTVTENRDSVSSVGNTDHQGEEFPFSNEVEFNAGNDKENSDKAKGEKLVNATIREEAEVFDEKKNLDSQYRTDEERLSDIRESKVLVIKNQIEAILFDGQKGHTSPDNNVPLGVGAGKKKIPKKMRSKKEKSEKKAKKGMVDDSVKGDYERKRDEGLVDDGVKGKSVNKEVADGSITGKSDGLKKKEFLDVRKSSRDRTDTERVKEYRQYAEFFEKPIPAHKRLPEEKKSPLTANNEQDNPKPFCSSFKGNVRRLLGLKDPRVSFSLIEGRIRPFFKEKDVYLGKYCERAGLTVDDLNAEGDKDVNLTKGVIVELFDFYHARGCTLTSLADRLLRLKKICLNSIINLVAKFGPLAKLRDNEVKMNELFVFPPGEYNVVKRTPNRANPKTKKSLKSDGGIIDFDVYERPKKKKKKKKKVEDTYTCELVIADESKKPKKKKTKKHSEEVQDSRETAPKGKNSKTKKTGSGQVEDTQSYIIDKEVEKARGKEGSVTRADIVLLYADWLKEKSAVGSNVFVTDLLRTVENLMQERKVQTIRIPAGTLMSSSVKLYEEYRRMWNTNKNDAMMYLEEDWLEDIQYLVSITQTSRRNTIDGENGTGGGTVGDGHIYNASENDALTALVDGGHVSDSSSERSLRIDESFVSDDPDFSSFGDSTSKNKRKQSNLNGEGTLPKKKLATSKSRKHPKELMNNALTKGKLLDSAVNKGYDLGEPGKSPSGNGDTVKLGKPLAGKGNRPKLTLPKTSGKGKNNVNYPELSAGSHVVSSSLGPAIEKNGSPVFSDQEYVIEKVIDYKCNIDKDMKKQVSYLVRWQGHGQDQDSWVNEEQLQCPETLNKYWCGSSSSSKYDEGMVLKWQPLTECQKLDLSKKRDLLETANNIPDNINASVMTECSSGDELNDKENSPHSLGTKRKPLLGTAEHAENSESEMEKKYMTNGELLQLYDDWRQEHQSTATSEKPNIIDLKSLTQKVQKAMLVYGIKTIYSDCLLQACFLLTVMRRMLISEEALKEFLGRDCVPVLEASQAHQQKHRDKIQKKNSVTVGSFLSSFEKLQTDFVDCKEKRSRSRLDMNVVEKEVECLQKALSRTRGNSHLLSGALQQEVSKLDKRHKGLNDESNKTKTLHSVKKCMADNPEKYERTRSALLKCGVTEDSLESVMDSVLRVMGRHSSDVQESNG